MKERPYMFPPSKTGGRYGPDRAGRIYKQPHRKSEDSFKAWDEKKDGRLLEMLRQAAVLCVPLQIPVWVRFGSNGKDEKFYIRKSPAI